MKCQKCGTNEANVTIKQNINGNKSIYHLCSKCANEEEIININTNFSSVFDDMFEDFDNIFSDMFTHKSNILIGPKEENKLKYSDKHKLNSYKIGTNNKEEKNDSIEDIKVLELKLKQAVDNENYEQAAIIRDKIKALKKKEK